MASSSVSQEDTNENENNQGTLSKKTMKIRSPRTNQVKIHQQQQQQQMQHHDENEVKSQSFPQTSDSPILNRTRSKTERDKLRVGGTSTNSKLRMQRERRRTKRREAYMPSTEGTVKYFVIVHGKKIQYKSLFRFNRRYYSYIQ